MKKKMKINNSSMQTRLPQKLLEQLDLFATDKGVNRSDCVRIAVEMFLADDTHYKQMSVTDFIEEV